MPSLTAAQLPAIEEEPDTSVEAVVVAAIRLHECIEASLRRLAETSAWTPRESGFRATGGMACLTPAIPNCGSPSF